MTRAIANQPALVLAEDSLIAGNLKLYLEQAFVSFPPQDFPLAAIAGRRELLLAWDAGKRPSPPPELLAYLGLQPATPIATLMAQIFTTLYFAFFLLMPIYSKMDKTKPVPERVTSK